MTRPVPDVFFDVAGEGICIVRQEEMRVVDNVTVTGVLERFWPAAEFAVGREQASFDKQYVRNYLETLTWGKTYPGPTLPDEVVVNTRAKYVEAYEKLTGKTFVA